MSQPQARAFLHAGSTATARTANPRDQHAIVLQQDNAPGKTTRLQLDDSQVRHGSRTCQLTTSQIGRGVWRSKALASDCDIKMPCAKISGLTICSPGKTGTSWPVNNQHLTNASLGMSDNSFPSLILSRLQPHCGVMASRCGTDFHLTLVQNCFIDAVRRCHLYY